MNVQLEKVSSLQRELGIKSTQLTEFEQRLSRSQDELDLAQYKL
jgi:predicted  nucleic acid-binding Zn-ribbon protein